MSASFDVCMSNTFRYVDYLHFGGFSRDSSPPARLAPFSEKPHPPAPSSFRRGCSCFGARPLRRCGASSPRGRAEGDAPQSPARGGRQLASWHSPLKTVRRTVFRALRIPASRGAKGCPSVTRQRRATAPRQAGEPFCKCASAIKDMRTEGFQRAIGKPFGRARRRESSLPPQLAEGGTASAAVGQPVSTSPPDPLSFHARWRSFAPRRPHLVSARGKTAPILWPSGRTGKTPENLEKTVDK